LPEEAPASKIVQRRKADDFGLPGCLREGRAEQLSGDAPIVSPRRYLLRSPRSFTRSAHAIRLTGLKPHGLVSPSLRRHQDRS
jgi:hypothetical protein